MPFTWIRISSSELYGERVAALVEGLGIEPVLALGHLTALCGMISQHRPDGDIRTVPAVLLERWAEWRGERGALASVVHGALCDPPGILRDWIETMGKLVAEAEKDRRRKKVAYDKLREAREREAAKDQLTLEGEATPYAADVPRSSPGESAEEVALRGDSADSPDTRTNGRTDVRTYQERSLTGTVGGAAEAEPAGQASRAVVVDKSARRGKLAADPGRADPLAGLPPSAVRLLSLFYANADGRRKRDVLEQLRDTIDPVRPGAKLDSKTWVRARSVDELETACAAVLHNPPRDLDLGVRFVLHQLTTLQARAAKAATEGTAARSEAEELRLASWHRARAIAVSKWELEHKDEARDLLAQAELAVPNDAVESAGKIGRMVRLEHYAALVAERMKFPPADSWHAPPAPSGRTLSRLGAH